MAFSGAPLKVKFDIKLKQHIKSGLKVEYKGVTYNYADHVCL